MTYTAAELVEFFEYLDDLRAGGSINMMGCGQYLEAEFDMDRREARDVAMAWMKSFDGESSPADRAASILAKATA